MPQFGNISGGFRVRHREYLGDIVASSVAGAFNIQQFAINPGLFSSFPWLCSISSQYDKWTPNGIVVCVNSLSSTYSGTSSLGTIAIATDYDVLDPPYANKIEMENSQFATSGNTSQSLLHPIECKSSLRTQATYKTRFGAISTTDNLRFYDHCNVYVATSGCTANQVVAELWISYDITFFYPQLGGGLLGRTIQAMYGSGAGCSSGSPFGTLTQTSTSTFNINTSGSTITFPANLTSGTFYVSLEWTGTSVSIAAGAPAYSGALPGPSLTPAGTNSYSNTTDAGNSGSFAFTVTLNGNYTVPQLVTIPAATFSGSVSLKMRIYQISAIPTAT